jgi:hypothetical protein
MLRRTRCPHCKAKLLEGQRIHPECIDEWSEKQAAKAERKAQGEARARAKVDRAKDRARRRALETIPELIKVAQREFNSWTRERDKDKGCISCGRTLRHSGGGGTGGDFDCGHFRSTGSASHLRFDERNAHGQCKHCNNHLSGNVVEYRKRLALRLGLATVEAIEADNHIHKWTKEELREIATRYRAKLKELKARNDDVHD